jgi:beta-galactosidase
MGTAVPFHGGPVLLRYPFQANAYRSRCASSGCDLDRIEISRGEVVVAIGATPCTTAPPAPVGFSSSVSGRFVSLGWAASGMITSIVLEAGHTPGASNAAVLVLAGTDRAYSTNAPPVTYYVRVRAMNACGSSAASNEVAVIVP